MGTKPLIASGTKPLHLEKQEVKYYLTVKSYMTQLSHTIPDVA